MSRNELKRRFFEPLFDGSALVVLLETRSILTDYVSGVKWPFARRQLASAPPQLAVCRPPGARKFSGGREHRISSHAEGPIWFSRAVRRTPSDREDAHKHLARSMLTPSGSSSMRCGIRWSRCRVWSSWLGSGTSRWSANGATRLTESSHGCRMRSPGISTIAPLGRMELYRPPFTRRRFAWEPAATRQA